MRFLPLATACVVFFSSPFSWAESAKIYDPEAKKEPLFTYETSSAREGQKAVVTTIYKSMDGKPVVQEKTTYIDGKFSLYEYQQFQVDEKGSIGVKDGKIHYSFTSEGKTKEETASTEEHMIVPDMIEGEIRANWDALMKDDEVRVRFLAVEELDSIGFKLFRDKETTIGGASAVDIIFKPSSFFIAALVSPFHLYVEKAAPHRLLRMIGRLPVRRPKVNPPRFRHDWKALDGLMEFEK